MSYENPWTYNGNLFDSGDIGDNYGFIYRITIPQMVMITLAENTLLQSKRDHL